MMKPAAAPDPLAQLTEIRTIMERSSRFLSLSGLSGVGAGTVAVVLAVPLVAGGLFCLRLYLGGDAGMVVPGLLVFYGLALLNASKYTLDEIRWLGLTQVVLGLLATLQPGWSLLYFALGFGLGHIGYGLLMYNRYERPGAAGAAAQ